MTSDYARHDAIGLAELVRRGETTASELLEAAAVRAERVNPALNAIVRPMLDEARAAIAAGLPSGPLSGVPFLLKDLNACYAGVPLTNGSRFFADFVPTEDSVAVRRLRAGGLVIFGKTNTSEFGLHMMTEPRLFGPSRNPWDRSRTPGGSSGGAAAAVAAGIVPAAHASDGGGSIRIPAGCCGLFGLKPSRGRVPMGPFGLSAGMLVGQNVISRSVRDSAAFLDVLGGFSPDEHYASPPAESFAAALAAKPARLSVAYSTKRPGGGSIHPECVAAVESAAKLCAGLGHELVETEPGYDAAAFDEALSLYTGVQVAAVLKARTAMVGRAPGPDEIEPVTRACWTIGETRTAVELATAVETLYRIAGAFKVFLDRFDAFLCPTLAEPPPQIGSISMMDEDSERFTRQVFDITPFCHICNTAGVPSMNVPLQWTADGLPIGVIFTSRFGNEALLLRLARELEEARPWADRRPRDLDRQEAA
jgi:Asp-tRNA(Asn)/Glu-tRNA(Gln) amidotransferase A subunit family amidase